MRRGRGLVVVAVAAIVVATACGGGAKVTAKLGQVPKSTGGNVVSIPVSIEGIQVVKADGDTSGKTGHFHVFIDREPVAVGETIAKGPGIVHSAENPIKVYGLAVGSHTFHVVLGNGAHRRIDGDVDLTFTVNVKGPSVDATAPATLQSGEDLTIGIESSGVEVVKADGDTSGKSGHYHVLVDPTEPPQAGDTIPAAVPNKVVHSTEDSVTIEGLAKGEHTIWVVLGDGTHKAFDPPVMDKLTVTVG